MDCIFLWQRNVYILLQPLLLQAQCQTQKYLINSQISSQIILHDSVEEVQFFSEVEIPVLRKTTRFTKEEWDGEGLGEEAEKLLRFQN